jgi:hypothetical protein
MFALNAALALAEPRFSPAIEINVDRVFPQAVLANRGDTVRWVSPTQQATVVDSFSGDFRLNVSGDTGWSAVHRFDTRGTNYYRQYPAASSAGIADSFPVVARTGIVIVRDWTNNPPVILINSPVEGSVFNYGEVNREPIPFLATPADDADTIDHIELLSNDTLFTAVTNAPYYLSTVRLPLGSHRLVARRVNRDGTSQDSPPVQIMVQVVVAPILFVELVSDRTLVMVSWLRPVDAYLLGRDENVLKVHSAETSTASGARFWIERAQTSPQAFYIIRQRF